MLVKKEININQTNTSTQTVKQRNAGGENTGLIN